MPTIIELLEKADLSIEKPYIELLTGEEIDNLIQAVGKLGLEKIKNVVH